MSAVTPHLRERSLPHSSGFVSSTRTITKRAALRYLRTPRLIVMATLQMSLFFLVYRFMFGGAINVGSEKYVDYLAPGFITTGVLFSGIGAAVATAEDLEQGFVDRLRSLPIPRSSVLAARAIADTAILTLACLVTVAVAYVVGFRLHGTFSQAIAALGLVVLFGFAFEWVFVTIGLFAGTGQAAQGIGMIVFPFAFISSAYVPVESMPGWLQVFAKHQPLTYMVNAVRRLTLGSQAGAVHPTSFYVIRALIWTAAIFVVFVPLAVAKFKRT